MSGELAKGFLDDIVANIDDDTPRLVYADWLAEQGKDERAEFIRVQVEQARLPWWDVTRLQLQLREQELLKRHGEEWLAEVPAVEGAKWEGFRRGIVAEVSFASFEAMRTRAHACRAVAPVEAVTVRWPQGRETGQTPLWGDLAAPIAELRELSLTGRPAGEREISWLAGSPQLSTLRVLTARGLWAEGLGRLVASPHLARLKALRLPANNLGNRGILAMIQTAALSELEDLDLSGRGVSERYNEDPTVTRPGMESLAGWSGLATVRYLNLSRNDLGRASLGTLLRSRHASGLKELKVRGTRLDGHAMAEFANAPPEFQLEVLDLGDNVLRLRGAESVASAPCLRQLKVLWLDRCEIPLTGARALAKARFLDGLQMLDVAHNHFGPVGLGALLKREPPALHTLRLRDNDVFDQGAVLLAESPASNTLHALDLSQNGLGATAAQALGDSTQLGKLLMLYLVDNPIHKSAVTALAASALGQRLAVLQLVDRPDAVDPTDDDFVEYDEDEFEDGEDMPF